jgi:hypothetical protein
MAASLRDEADYASIHSQSRAGCRRSLFRADINDHVGDFVSRCESLDDDLDPDVLTARLGALPTVGRPTGRKRDLWVGPATKRKVISKSGGWCIELGTFIPGDLNKPSRELFQKMTDDLDVWRNLSARFSGRISTLVWMKDSDEGFQVEPATLMAIAERGLALDIETLAPS